MYRLRALLVRGTVGIVIGYSPVLSVSLTVDRLASMSRIRIMSMGGRYGRLLFVLNSRISRDVDVHAMGFRNRDIRTFSCAIRRRRSTRYICASAVNHFLCRPGDSVVGTNYFHLPTMHCKLSGLRHGARLCASSGLIPSFPKHIFRIGGVSKFNGGRLGHLSSRLGGTGVTMHGFPRHPRTLHGHLGVTSKNSTCLFTAALSSRGQIVVRKRGIGFAPW